MSSTIKILIGAVLTALIGAWAGSQFGLCDRCANTTVAATPAAPPAATAEVAANCQASVDAVTTGKTINFETSGATIAASSMAEIDALATALKGCSAGSGLTVEVAGHTDITGGDAANMALSQARAASVVKALTDKGVAAGQLIAKGYGETKPLVAGASPEANAKNRRTEFHVQAAAAAAPAN